jgi:hypothetical protein
MGGPGAASAAGSDARRHAESERQAMVHRRSPGSGSRILARKRSALLQAQAVAVQGGTKKKKSSGTCPELQTSIPRRRPTLPRGLPRSTIGAEGLNCRVRPREISSRGRLPAPVHSALPLTPKG